MIENNLRKTEAERYKALHDYQRIETELLKLRSGESSSSQGNAQALTDAVMQVHMLEDASKQRELQLVQVEQQFAAARAEIQRLNNKLLEEEQKKSEAINEIDTLNAKSTAQQHEIRDLQLRMQNTASDESHRPAKRSRATRNNDDVSDEGSDDSPLLNTLLASIEALRISITCQGERMTEMTSAFARTATTLGNQAIEAKFTQLQITLPVDNTQNNNNNNNNSSIQTAIERPSDLLQKNNWLDTH